MEKLGLTNLKRPFQARVNRKAPLAGPPPLARCARYVSDGASVHLRVSASLSSPSRPYPPNLPTIGRELPPRTRPPLPSPETRELTAPGALAKDGARLRRCTFLLVSVDAPNLWPPPPKEPCWC